MGGSNLVVVDDAAVVVAVYQNRSFIDQDLLAL